MIGALQVVQQMVAYVVEGEITEEQALLAIERTLHRARNLRNWAGVEVVRKSWAQDTVREVGQRVAQAAQQYVLKQGGQAAARWQTLDLEGVIVPDSSPNMGVRGGWTPWGMQAVVVTTEGFLRMIEEDLPAEMFSEALAAVTAHEFSHLLYRVMDREDKGPADEAEEFDADGLGVEIAEAAGFTRAREGAILSMKAALARHPSPQRRAVLHARIEALEVA